MKTLRIVLTAGALALAYALNVLMDAAQGPLSGEAALLQLENSDAAAIASKSLSHGVSHLSWVAVAAVVVLLAIIWLYPAGKKNKDDQQ